MSMFRQAGPAMQVQAGPAMQVQACPEAVTGMCWQAIRQVQPSRSREVQAGKRDHAEHTRPSADLAPTGQEEAGAAHQADQGRQELRGVKRALAQAEPLGDQDGRRAQQGETTTRE